MDEILAGYAAVHANASARGFARAAQAYAELGRVQPVRKLLPEAESRLKKGDSDGHLALAVAYAAAGQFAPAIEHAIDVRDEWRVDGFLRVARAANGRDVESTPELAEALSRLPGNST